MSIFLSHFLQVGKVKLYYMLLYNLHLHPTFCFRELSVWNSRAMLHPSQGSSNFFHSLILCLVKAEYHNYDWIFSWKFLERSNILREFLSIENGSLKINSKARSLHLCLETGNLNLIHVDDKIISLKKCYKETYLQNRNRLTNLENKFMVTEGERRSGEELGVLVKVLEKLGDYLFYVHTTTYK